MYGVRTDIIRASHLFPMKLLWNLDAIMDKDNKDICEEMGKMYGRLIMFFNGHCSHVGVDELEREAANVLRRLCVHFEVYLPVYEVVVGLCNKKSPGEYLKGEYHKIVYSLLWERKHLYGINPCGKRILLQEVPLREKKPRLDF